jgi:hypothetical protein
MTIMAAEAGAGAATAGASEASAGARQSVRRSPRPKAPPRGSSFSDEAVAERRALRSRRASTGPASRPAPAPAGRQGGSQRRSTSRRPRATITSGDRISYQTVVLAEFVAAVLLVAATPFAKKESAGISPYVGADLVQLVALTLVYFVLALISGANRGAGRFAAWFGALVLLTVGLGEAARIARLLNVFGLESPPAPAGPPPQAV